MNCHHTIGLIYYPYEGCATINDGEQEPVKNKRKGATSEEITLFDYCPDCGKKLCIIEQKIDGKTVLADV